MKAGKIPKIVRAVQNRYRGKIYLGQHGNCDRMSLGVDAGLADLTPRRL
jgi:hypothetical protein